MAGDGPAEYLGLLRALPFVRSAALASRKRGQDLISITVRTPTTQHELSAAVVGSEMSYVVADHTIRRLQAAAGLGLLLAPEIGRDMGRYLEERGILFLDLQGNCNVVLGDCYVARVEGRRAPKPIARAQTSMRAAGYSVLFALLAQPELASRPLRQIAEAGGVSRQAASDVLARLLASGAMVRSKDTHRWVPHRLGSELERWLVGYVDVLRPALLFGSFRSPDATPDLVEQRVARALLNHSAWRWGGSAAGYRLTRYYRGMRTVVHLDDLTPELRRAMKLVPDREGPIVVLGLPGPVALQGATPDTPHPLLVYAEMLAEANERAREAAGEVAERYLPELKPRS